MEQTKLIPEIKRLCEAHQYDDAIKLTNKLENRRISIEAHLLCIEHERRYHIDCKQYQADIGEAVDA